MKDFIKSLLAFFTPIVLIFTLAFLFIGISIKTKFDNFRLSENITKIVIGDSHIRLAIDDSMLDNTRNIALDSEGYIYSYYKLKGLIENNRYIDTIYLGASYHNFSAYYDKAETDPNIVATYFFILPFYEKMSIFSKIENKSQFVLNSLKLIVRPNKFMDWLGSYADYTTKSILNTESINKRIKTQYYINNKLQDFSLSNGLYFNKIVELCKVNDKVLIILNTPLHTIYKNKIPKKFIENYFSIIKMNNLIINEFEYQIFNDDDFLPDGDHVSRKGAVKISLKFR